MQLVIINDLYTCLISPERCFGSRGICITFTFVSFFRNAALVAEVNYSLNTTKKYLVMEENPKFFFENQNFSKCIAALVNLECYPYQILWTVLIRVKIPCPEGVNSTPFWCEIRKIGLLPRYVVGDFDPFRCENWKIPKFTIFRPKSPEPTL